MDTPNPNRLLQPLAAASLLVLAFTIREYAPHLIWLGHFVACAAAVLICTGLATFLKRLRLRTFLDHELFVRAGDPRRYLA